MKKIYFVFIEILLISGVFAQNVGIGTTSPHANAALEIVSNNKGLLIPRLTQTEINNIADPPTGLLVYNTISNSFQYYNSVSWINITNSAIVTGTNNRIPRFTGYWGLGNGLMTDNLSGVSVKNPAADADASAMLDVQSNSKGVLFPRMTLAERNVIASPATGLLIYQTDNSPGFYYYGGAGWIQMSTGGGTNYWTLNGTHIYSNTTGNVGIGINPPAFRLDVMGRMRVKAGTVGNVLTSAGIWMDDYRDGTTNRFFFGMKDSIRAGFYGGGPGGVGWDFIFNTRDGNIGIGELDPFYKLTVNGEIGLRRNTQNGVITYGTFLYETGSLLMNAKTGNPLLSIEPEHIILQKTNSPFTTGNVGIATSTPDVRLHIDGGTDVTASGGGYLQIGATASANLGFDNNEIQARNNGTAASLFIQANGGDLQIGGTNNIIINDGYQVYRNRPLSTNADLLPIAYGRISSGGTALSGTGNLSVTKPGTGEYRIVLLGESNLFANSNQYTILVTVNGISGFAIARYIAASIQNDNAIWVRIAYPTINWTNVNLNTQCGCPSGTLASYLSSGVESTLIDADFSIVIYKM
jgi:hypothetical protein